MRARACNEAEMHDRSLAPTSILLIRHAEVHNPDDVLYGRLPRFRLSGAGRQQAARLADVLAAEELAAVWSSPRLRARQTAAEILRCHPGLPLRVSGLLDEVRTSWQGRPHRDLAAIAYDPYATPLSPDDESISDVWRRLERFIARALRAHPGQTVACVSHGDPILIAVAGLLGRPLRTAAIRPERYPPPASFYRLEFPAAGWQPRVTFHTLDGDRLLAEA